MIYKDAIKENKHSLGTLIKIVLFTLTAVQVVVYLFIYLFTFF